MPVLTPRSLVYELQQLVDPRISPDAASIAYVTAWADQALDEQAMEVWLCDLEGSGSRRISRPGVRCRTPRWSPDGAAIAYLEDGPTGTAVVVHPPTGTPKFVSWHDSHITDIAWRSDGRQLAFIDAGVPTAPSPTIFATRRIDYRRDGIGLAGDRRPQVFVVDLQTGDTARLTTGAQEHFGPVWSPTRDRLAVGVRNWATLTSEVALLDPVSGSSERVTLGPRGHADSWAWAPDGNRLLILGEDAPTAQPSVFLLDLLSSRLERVAPTLDILPLPSVTWLDDSHVLMHALSHGRSGLYVLDIVSGHAELEAHWDAVHWAFPLGSDTTVDDSHRYVVQARSSHTTLGEIARYDRGAKRLDIVKQANTAVLAERATARTERLAIQRDDMEIEGWMLYPPGFDPARRHPVVVLVHAGPEFQHGHWFSPWQQCLAGAGYLVVAPNPRGSTSYGRAFTDAIIGDWGSGPLEDLMAVLDHVVDRPYADGSRVGIVGYSYGGYLTAFAIGRTDRFAAAVVVEGIFDLTSQYLSSDSDFAYGDVAWAGPPFADRAWYAEHSPSTYVHVTRTPTLIMHGEDDLLVPIHQAEQLFTTLQRVGIESELVRYTDADHFFVRFGRPSQRLDVMERMVDWFGQHLVA
jgi:dipeptidyl aminopeptidase/acylaminoacyl peptidase